jgi:excinuclease UvrABC nuclease subunit
MNTNSEKNIELIYRMIKDPRRPVIDLCYKKFELPSKPGIYGIFLVRKDELFNDFTFNKDCLLYIGISNNLSKRDVKQHFCANNSSQSTFRRSIGAIKKEECDFKANRSKKKPPKDCQCYQFNDQDEEKITKWMKCSLEIGYYPCEAQSNLTLKKEMQQIESDLIKEYDPPLNILHRMPSISKDHLLMLRHQCKLEADRSNK